MGPLVVPLVTGAISLFSNLFGAHKQTQAANESARLQTQAHMEAARLAKQAADDALAYTREESVRARASEEAARYGNYQQSAARERRLGTLGDMLGFGQREIPGYVPLDGSNDGSIGAMTGAPPADLSGAATAFNSLFPDEALTPAMLTAKQKELEAAGFTLRPNAAGVVGKVQYRGGPIIDVIQGAASGVNKKQWLVGGPAMAPRPVLAPYAPGTIGAMVQPTRVPLTPRLDVDPTRYPLGTLGSFATGQRY